MLSRGASVNRRISIVLFFALAALFLFTPVRNRSEAEDAYNYALQVERGPVQALGHRHHLLYAPAMRFVLLAAQRLGYQGRSMPIMTTFSALSGAASAVLVFLICRNRLGLTLAGSVLAAVLLSLSYGFWRYACEAEIYVPATATALLAIYLATSPVSTWSRSTMAGVVAGFGVLIHVLNVLPAVLTVGLFLRRRRWRPAITYGAVAALMVVTTYAAFAGGSFRSQDDLRGDRADFSLRRTAQPSTYARAAVGLGQSIVTGNFLFTHPSLSARLQKMFPHRMLDEEIFMGQAAPPAARVLPWISLAGFLLSAGILAWLRTVRRKEGVALFSQTSTVGAGTLTLVMALWAAAYAGLVLLFEPGNSEMWIMGLAPLSILLGCLVLDPVIRAHGVVVPVVLAACLGLHSVVGGFLLLANPAGDFHAMKAREILNRAGQGDVVLTAGDSVFFRFARYHADARVEHLYEWPPAALASRYAQICIEAHDIYATGDLFAAQPVLGVKFPDRYAAVRTFSEAVRGEFELVAEDDFGGVYQRRIALAGKQNLDI
jgi:hypothetical protein